MFTIIDYYTEQQYCCIVFVLVLYILGYSCCQHTIYSYICNYMLFVYIIHIETPSLYPLDNVVLLYIRRSIEVQYILEILKRTLHSFKIIYKECIFRDRWSSLSLYFDLRKKQLNVFFYTYLWFYGSMREQAEIVTEWSLCQKIIHVYAKLRVNHQQSRV